MRGGRAAGSILMERDGEPAAGHQLVGANVVARSFAGDGVADLGEHGDEDAASAR